MTNKILINGVWRDGAGAEFSSSDPSTGETIWTGAAATKNDVSAAVSAARGAFEKWALTPLAERIAIMERYRDLIKRDAEELARLISRETGKPFWETKTEAATVSGKVDISIRAYHERTGEKETATGATRGVLRHKPHGVMAVLGPYNFPAHLPNGHIVPALIAGNTVVFKPSEMTPGPGAFIVERMMEAGVPEGVVNLVQGGRETGEALTGADVDGVLFTGGAKTGLAIHKMFADRLDVILALELGGNNPLIWWDVDDVDAAAFTVVQSAFLTSGQRCTCARRLIVPEGPEGDKALLALAKLTERLIVGAPFDDPQPFMGPVISPKIAEGLERAFDQLVDSDGVPVRNLSVIDEGKSFVSPGIIDVTMCADSVPDEEHFGPFLKVYRVKNFDDAIARANKTKFGLSAGILTDDKAKWEKFLALSRAGIVNWNRQTTGASGAAPFGGIGDSGNHRPSAYYAADYCAYPVASMEGEGLLAMPEGQVGVR
ncbi:succinylglutamate-semialdehyde dehydrogenase [Marinicaulis aureus]|uniref:N-succinylglutamate 5-semialdehyde dehydrogenase n=1 Tax=Hyphococcus aureus TaxID=2666033 RepID=A0ABW1L003_9PROT